MNKKELIEQTAKRAGMTKKAAAAVVNAMIDCITEELAGGGKVRLVGFGCFEVRRRRMKNGVNPHTRQRLLIPATLAPKFTPGRGLKTLVSAAADR